MAIYACARWVVEDEKGQSLANRISFSASGEFQEWAASKKRCVPHLTTRLLLRTIPHIGRMLEESQVDPPIKESFCLGIFRATFCSWTLSNRIGDFEDQVLDIDIRSIRESILNSKHFSLDDILSIKRESELSRLAIQSISSYLLPRNPVDINFSVGATASISQNSFNSKDSIWGMIALDASLIDAGMSTQELSIAPLWPDENPYWFDSALRMLSKEMLELSENWSFWLDWYNVRVNGGYSKHIGEDGEKYLTSRMITEGNDWWDQSPNIVNKDIIGWAAAEHVKHIGQSSIGNTWKESEHNLFLSQHGDKSDDEIAENKITVQLHDGIKRRIGEFALIAQEIEEIYGWDRFADKFRRFANSLNCTTAFVPENIGHIYDCSLEIASYLDFDDDLRREPWGNASALDASRRRELENLIVATGPWLRRFPTARGIDDDAGSYFENLPDRLLATQLVAEAGKQQLISDEDRQLLKDLLSILETRGHLSDKSVKRGIFTVKNLIVAAASIATFYSGSIASDFAEKSVVVQKAGDFLAKNEAAVLEYLKGNQPDIRHSVEVVIERAKQQRDREPASPIEPVKGTGYENRRKE